MTNKRKVFDLSEGRFPTYKECCDETLHIKGGNKFNELFIKEVFKLVFGEADIRYQYNNHFIQRWALDFLEDLIKYSRVKMNEGGRSLRYPRGQEYLDDNAEWEKD